MTGSLKKIISFNSFYDDIEINNEKILKKLGKFYFDNVNYFYIDTGLNNKIYKKDLNFLDLQNIESKMDKYTIKSNLLSLLKEIYKMIQSKYMI